MFLNLNMQKHENKIKMYIFRICTAIQQDFDTNHFLKTSLHHDYTKLYCHDYTFLKLEIKAFITVKVSILQSFALLNKSWVEV